MKSSVIIGGGRIMKIKFDNLTPEQKRAILQKLPPEERRKLEAENKPKTAKKPRTDASDRALNFGLFLTALTALAYAILIIIFLDNNKGDYIYDDL